MDVQANVRYADYVAEVSSYFARMGDYRRIKRRARVLAVLMDNLGFHENPGNRRYHEMLVARLAELSVEHSGYGALHEEYSIKDSPPRGYTDDIRSRNTLADLASMYRTLQGSGVDVPEVVLEDILLKMLWLASHGD